ncbi:MAG: tRNA (adenosine(37)-N6)-threonylcarbamoyltransferase complex transferase subunit TsaD [Salibacteraceae bacterium]
MSAPVIILGIESSCDDTSASVVIDGVKVSNVTANQSVHEEFGGVVPELASRAHQQNIVPTVMEALKQANVKSENLTAIGYTRGPGLLGSLLVGSSFAKGFALSLDIPLIEVNHMQAHILAHFISEKDGSSNIPQFPFLCLTVSGGHTQIVEVTNHFDMKLLGQTKDDAAGEAFDKVAKIMGLGYPGGPIVDKLASKGNPHAFEFPRSKMQGLNYSFSGLKTAVLYFLQKNVAENPNFVEENKQDICASVQYTIIETLLGKVKRAVKETKINRIAVAGGVSANSGLRNSLTSLAKNKGWKVYIPKMEYTTDNGAMIAIAAHLKYLKGDYSKVGNAPLARLSVENDLGWKS